MSLHHTLKLSLVCSLLLMATAVARGQATQQLEAAPQAAAAQQYKLYDARTADWEILTPKPAAAPRINGPTIYGARAGKEFLYRIPCQGERPIRFEAKGLPDGLALDAQKGIITGRSPLEPGTYPVEFTAKNAAGTAVRAFKIVVGEKIALTPPMGWNSWGGHMLMVDDALMRKATDLMVDEGLADVGFQYVSIDDCWMRIDPEYFRQNRKQFEKRMPGFPFEEVVGPPRDEHGRVLPNGNFPDMKAMTDYIHSFGLKAGIYSSPGPRTCQNFIGSFGYEREDAEQYAAWGFDLLKYDLCSGRVTLAQLQRALPAGSPEISQLPVWYPMTQFLAAQDRDILYNLCQYGLQSPWEWAGNLGIESWRIGGDLNHHVETYFEQTLRIAKELREHSKPGHWNDPDFMYIHKIRDFQNKMGPTKEIPLTSNQRYQYVSLWSIVCAPYFFSADITALNDFTIALLANAEIANVNQDELGHVAEVIRESDDEVVMLKKLADGAHVLAVFNRDMDGDHMIAVGWKEIGLAGKHALRDLWRQKDLGAYAGGVTINVSPGGCAVLRVE
ncbi:MAG: putative Ig domain-containing protein [Planctomycetota bacterium]